MSAVGGDTRQRIAEAIAEHFSCFCLVAPDYCEAHEQVEAAADAVVAVLASGEPDGVRVSRGDLRLLAALADDNLTDDGVRDRLRCALSPEPEEPTT